MHKIISTSETCYISFVLFCFFVFFVNLYTSKYSGDTTCLKVYLMFELWKELVKLFLSASSFNLG